MDHFIYVKGTKLKLWLAFGRACWWVCVFFVVGGVFPVAAGPVRTHGLVSLINLLLLTITLCSREVVRVLPEVSWVLSAQKSKTLYLY